MSRVRKYALGLYTWALQQPLVDSHKYHVWTAEVACTNRAHSRNSRMDHVPYFHQISIVTPREVCWALHQNTRYFVDVHPSLTKLRITAAAFSFAFDGDVDFKGIDLCEQSLRSKKTKPPRRTDRYSLRLPHVDWSGPGARPIWSLCLS
ncbi:hypothetical protein EDC04DRAFT_458261 [Pisolithus marmoratus]|nr:hypothetical protein EDC04DRAFT_458261 [Pisolithus marmoratus]